MNGEYTDKPTITCVLLFLRFLLHRFLNVGEEVFKSTITVA